MTTETKKSVPIIKKTEKLKAISKAISKVITKENPIAKVIEQPKEIPIVKKESVILQPKTTAIVKKESVILQPKTTSIVNKESVILQPKATSIVNKENVSEEANVASDVSEETNVDSDETNTTSNLLTQVSEIGLGSVSKILSEKFDTGTNTSLMNKINNMKGTVTGGKVSILNKLFIVLLGIIIIAVSSSGYYVKKHCGDKNITINSSMVEFFMGFGTGLLFYVIFDTLKIVSVPIIIILGLFLSVIGGMYINIYNRMNTECTENSMAPELSIGILGCGIGIITFALLYTILNFLKNPVTRIRIVALITCTFLIIIPSIIINMINKCSAYDDSVDQKTISSHKTAQIVSLVLSLLAFVGICVSFYFIPPV
jgi:hypothetical protein